MSGKLDLSSLPPEVRQKVEAGLARLPPEARRQWEERGSPLLAKLVSGLSATPAGRKPPPLPAWSRPTTPPGPPAGSSWRTADAPARTATDQVPPPRDAGPGPAQVIRRNPPRGHYNDTIAPGDNPFFLRRLLFALVVAGVIAWWLQ